MEQDVEALLLTEDELRTEMAIITRRYTQERNELKDAFKGLSKAKAVAHLAAKTLSVDLLKDPRAIEVVNRLKEAAKPPTEGDKEAVVILETETIQDRYDAAKFDCETSDRYFDKLEKQLSYFQSLMKFTGPTESPKQLTF